MEDNSKENQTELSEDLTQDQAIELLKNIRSRLDLDQLNDQYYTFSKEEQEEYYETMLKTNLYSFLQQFETNPEDITIKEWVWFVHVLKYFKVPLGELDKIFH